MSKISFMFVHFDIDWPMNNKKKKSLFGWITLNKQIIVPKNPNSMAITRRIWTHISNLDLNQELQNKYERKLGFGESPCWRANLSQILVELLWKYLHYVHGQSTKRTSNLNPTNLKYIIEAMKSRNFSLGFWLDWIRACQDGKFKVYPRGGWHHTWFFGCTSWF
jgi:hypothetical protein